MSNFFDRMIGTTSENFESAEPTTEEPVAVTIWDNEDANHPSSTPADIKKTVQELLKHGYVEEAQKIDLFRSAVVHERQIKTVLEPLDLDMRLDTHRGVAFLVVANAAYDERNEDASWLHPLVRRQRLTLEQSLLVAILRQAFVIHEQESGIGQTTAKLAVDDLLPEFMTYFGDTGSDAKNETRLLSLLEQLKPHGIVSEVDNKHEVTIRPLIAYIANPESLTALLSVLKGASQSIESAETDG